MLCEISKDLLIQQKDCYTNYHIVTLTIPKKGMCWFNTSYKVLINKPFVGLTNPFLQCSNPCENNGTCVNSLTGYKCNCPWQFTANVCEVRRHCLSNPCLNGGVCTDMVNGYRCNCKPEFSGQQCQYRTCVRNECQHGGSCVMIADSFKCLCPESFTGRLCGTRITLCTPNPCRNQGSCVIFSKEGTPDAYHCTCPKGTTGTHCEILYGKTVAFVFWFCIPNADLIQY